MKGVSPPEKDTGPAGFLFLLRKSLELQADDIYFCRIR